MLLLLIHCSPIHSMLTILVALLIITARRMKLLIFCMCAKSCHWLVILMNSAALVAREMDPSLVNNSSARQWVPRRLYIHKVFH